MYEQEKLYWTKDAFKYNHSIFSGAELVGEIKDSSLHRSVRATLFGKKYVFEKNGFIRTSIEIIEITDRKKLGTIKFKMFSSKALISFNDNTDRYMWKFKHSLTRRWEVINPRGEILLTGKSRKEGYVQLSDERSPLLLLSTLVIRNHLAMLGYG